MIVANQKIYYQNRIFKKGDVLPCTDKAMVKAWLECGTAIDTEATNKGKATAKNAVVNDPVKVAEKELKNEIEKTKHVLENSKKDAEKKKATKVTKVKTRSKK